MPNDSHLPQADPFSLVPTFNLRKCYICIWTKLNNDSFNKVNEINTRGEELRGHCMFGNMYSYIKFVCIALPFQSLPSISWLYSVWSVCVQYCICCVRAWLPVCEVPKPVECDRAPPHSPIVPGYSPPLPLTPICYILEGHKLMWEPSAPLFARIAEVPLQTSFFSLHILYIYSTHK